MGGGTCCLSRSEKRRSKGRAGEGGNDWGLPRHQETTWPGLWDVATPERAEELPGELGMPGPVLRGAALGLQRAGHRVQGRGQHGGCTLGGYYCLFLRGPCSKGKGEVLGGGGGVLIATFWTLREEGDSPA